MKPTYGFQSPLPPGIHVPLEHRVQGRNHAASVMGWRLAAGDAPRRHERRPVAPAEDVSRLLGAIQDAPRLERLVNPRVIQDQVRLLRREALEEQEQHAAAIPTAGQPAGAVPREQAAPLPLLVFREQPKGEATLTAGRRDAQASGHLHELRLGVPHHQFLHALAGQVYGGDSVVVHVEREHPRLVGKEVDCNRTAKLNSLIKCNGHHLNASGALV